MNFRLLVGMNGSRNLDMRDNASPTTRHQIQIVVECRRNVCQMLIFSLTVLSYIIISIMLVNNGRNRFVVSKESTRRLLTETEEAGGRRVSTSNYNQKHNKRNKRNATSFSCLLQNTCFSHFKCIVLTSFFSVCFSKHAL